MRYNRFCFALLLVGAVTAALACGGDDDPAKPSPTTTTAPTGSATTVTAPPAPPPSATTATATEPPAPCPVDQAACALAVQLADALAKKDWPAAAALFSGAVLTCPEPPGPVPAGLDPPETEACKGKAKGETVRGVILGYLQTDAVLSSTMPNLPAALTKLFTDSTPPPLYAIGTEGPATCLNCRVITLADKAANRSVVMRIVKADDGRWGATTIYRGSFTAIDQTGVSGRIYNLYQGPGKAWVPELFAKDAGLEYEATVNVGAGDCLNLRNDPSATGAVVRCIPHGAKVYVRETQNPLQQGGITWVFVALYEGGERITGYASKEFLKKP